MAVRGRVHLVGAGGAGMSALGRLLIEAGAEVSGSDLVDGPAARDLRDLGARVWIGHDAGHVSGAERVVVSPAIGADNVELKAARAAGLEVQTRAEALAELLQGRQVIAVAGSHGKTTTAAMLAFILRRAGLDPGYYIGGLTDSLDRIPARTGPGALFVLEACEAFGALDAWPASHALINNVDDEHVEHYGGEAALRQAFARLAGRSSGALVVGGDDLGAAELLVEQSRAKTFGLGPANGVWGKVRAYDETGSVAEVIVAGESAGEIRLCLPGAHNVRNALGAAAMAMALGVGFQTIAEALGDFTCVDRRTRRIGEAAGVQVFDDFAHHPTEVEAALAVARAAVADGGKLVVGFAPQIHSGVPRLAQRFARALSVADLILLAPTDALGRTAGLDAGVEFVADAIQATATAVVRPGAVDRLAPSALEHLANGDVFIAVGPAAAGVADQVLEGLSHRAEARQPDAKLSISRGRKVPTDGAPGLVGRVLAEARRRPEALAVLCGGEELTYAGLIERAELISASLAGAGLEPGDMVAVSLGRSPWRPAAFLGVLMAGGVFLPMDSALPAKRQRFMVHDARARFAVAGPDFTKVVEDDAIRIVDPSERPPLASDRAEPFPDPRGPDVAYVIYTSGTTGQPKGVVVEHGALANFARSAAEAFGVGETSRVSNASAFGFDVCIGEMAMALASGACLVLPPERTGPAGPALGRLVRDAQVTHLSLTPSALATLPAYDYPTLTHVIVAGEACPQDLADRWGAGRAFFNAYGPTEATVLATFDRHRPGGTLTIGWVMDNVSAFVLGDEGRPVRRGASGELWLAGAGLARGYLRRKELTQERFRDICPDGGKAVRAYRTGDVAAMLPDGRIRFLGRVDDQVKLRGFRIELGEVEACLGTHPAVEDAIAALRRDPTGREVLVGYVVPADPASPPAADELKEFLAARLPAYMTPSAILPVGAIPLSPNGKRDRSQLPAPPRQALRAGRPVKPPRPGLETSLHEIFRRELGLDGAFGVRDTLAELGADSLRSANLFLAIEARFGVEAPLEAAAHDNTVELLAVRIGRLLGAAPSTESVEPSLEATILRRQMTYLAGWTGARRTPESLIFTRGDGGSRSPLFWCFQGDEEHERLSVALGQDVTLHGMRSGHLVFSYSPETIGALASRYAQEIEDLQPDGPVRIGGNCQGGIIAQEVALRLMARGRKVETLFLLDPGRFPPSGASVSLIFGEGSDQNPYLGAARPERLFEDAYPAGYRVDFLPGAHGLYFEPPALDALARIIRDRIAAMEPDQPLAPR